MVFFKICKFCQDCEWHGAKDSSLLSNCGPRIPSLLMNPPYINSASRRRPSWNQRFGRKVERVHPLKRGGGG
jgi:hypothetical protein